MSLRDFLFLPGNARHADLGLLLLRAATGAFLVYQSHDNVFSAARMGEFVKFLTHFGFAWPELLAPLSVYAQFAAGLGLVLGLFARWLSDDESPQKQVATTNELYTLLTPGYVPALTARAKLIMENTYLAEPEAVLDMLERARANGDLKASLSLARAYERGNIVTADPKKAIKYAQEAREKYPSADYLLGRIYKRGYLGEPDPEKAKFHLLTAARRGFPKADYALAELYWEAKGIEVNRRYAWSFALLAHEGGVKRAKALLLEMVPTMPHHVEQAAEALYQRERAARRQMLAKAASAPAKTTEQGG